MVIPAALRKLLRDTLFWFEYINFISTPLEVLTTYGPQKKAYNTVEIYVINNKTRNLPLSTHI
jgi:hypothetical protein